jgi:hypothetical protein
LPLKGWVKNKCTYIRWRIASESVVFVELCPAGVNTGGHKRVVLILYFTSFILAKKPVKCWESIIKSIAV